MPPEQGRRGDHEGDPAVTRDDAAHRREKDPVTDPELRPTARPLENPELMAEDEDLEILGAVDPAPLATADDEPGEGADDEVEERPHRPIGPGLSDRESGCSTPTGRAHAIGAPPRRARLARRTESRWRPRRPRGRVDADPGRNVGAGRRSRGQGRAAPRDLRGHRRRRIVSARLTPSAYEHGLALAMPEVVMASPAGFEPATGRLEGGCSGPLSYGDVVRCSVYARN